MMNEEEYIRGKMDARNPFTVPEGYFDQLAEQVIGKLPAEVGTDPVPARPEPKPAIVRYLRPLLYAAACVGLAIAVGAVFRSAPQDDGNFVAQQQETATTTYSDTYFDDMADYAMLDNEDIYESLLADL